jgi:hypothetical protein
LPKRLPHLVQIIDTQTGLELTESWKSARVRVAGICVIIGIVASFTLMVFANFVWGGALLGGVLVVIYPVMVYNTNKTKVHVNTRHVDIRHGPMLYKRSVVVQSGDIHDIVKTHRKNVVDLEVQLRDGRKVTMLMGLADGDRVDFIIRQTRRHLNLIKAAPLPVLTVSKFSGAGRSGGTVSGDPAIKPEYA